MIDDFTGDGQFFPTASALLQRQLGVVRLLLLLFFAVPAAGLLLQRWVGAGGFPGLLLGLLLGLFALLRWQQYRSLRSLRLSVTAESVVLASGGAACVACSGGFQDGLRFALPGLPGVCGGTEGSGLIVLDYASLSLDRSGVIRRPQGCWIALSGADYRIFSSIVVGIPPELRAIAYSLS